jgi:hypothetical protein
LANRAIIGHILHRNPKMAVLWGFPLLTNVSRREKEPDMGLFFLRYQTPTFQVLTGQPMDNRDERYIWEKRENVCYDIRREKRG